MPVLIASDRTCAKMKDASVNEFLPKLRPQEQKSEISAENFEMGLLASPRKEDQQ